MSPEAVKLIEQICRALAGCIAIEKEWGMIYQFDLKLEAARDLGIPFSRLRHMPYDEWAAIRDPWLAGKR